MEYCFTVLGQSYRSPFMSQSVAGQTRNTSSDPSAPQIFGSTTPFGPQTGSPIFGVTSNGVSAAAQSSTPFPSSTTFGASFSTDFGNTMSTFGASSTPAFSSSSSPSIVGKPVDYLEFLHFLSFIILPLFQCYIIMVKDGY